MLMLLFQYTKKVLKNLKEISNNAARTQEDTKHKKTPKTHSSKPEKFEHDSSTYGPASTTLLVGQLSG